MPFWLFVLFLLLLFMFDRFFLKSSFPWLELPLFLVIRKVRLLDFCFYMAMLELCIWDSGNLTFLLDLS